MLNMQNVKDIEIPEGDVRTIHDKDNRLIWGRLAYDTKYAGDTFQQTYSGKNLLPVIDGTATTSGLTVTAQDGEVTINGTTSTSVCIKLTNGIVSSAGATPDVAWLAETTPISDLNGKTISLRYISGTPPSSSWAFRIYGSTTTYINQWRTETTDTTYSWSSNTNAVSCMCIFVNSGYTFSNYKMKFQIETGSSATAWEKFVGGIPAPNPDYPQAVQVVTGEQTVKVSDGGSNTQTFTIDLGPTELRKIDNYQDYIYKSGNDWYVHRETNKSVYSSSSGWGLGSTYDGYQGFYGGQYTMVIGRDTPIYTNYFKQVPYTTTPTEECFMINANSSNSTMIFYSKIMTSLSELNDYFSTTPMSVYFPLKTPVDTKITDATLVGQLEAVHEWLTRYGYNATVSGNLPIIISQTPLN